MSLVKTIYRKIFPDYNDWETLKKSIDMYDQDKFERCINMQFKKDGKDLSKKESRSLVFLFNYSLSRKNDKSAESIFIKLSQYAKSKTYYTYREDEEYKAIIAKLLFSTMKRERKDLLAELCRVSYDKGVTFYSKDKAFKEIINKMYVYAVEKESDWMLARLLNSWTFSSLLSNFNYPMLVAPSIEKFVENKRYDLFEVIRNSSSYKATGDYNSISRAMRNSKKIAIKNGELKFFEIAGYMKSLDCSERSTKYEDVFEYIKIAIKHNQNEVLDMLIEKNKRYLKDILMSNGVTSLKFFIQELQNNKEIYFKIMNTINTEYGYVRYTYEEEQNNEMEDYYYAILESSIKQEDEEILKTSIKSWTWFLNGKEHLNKGKMKKFLKCYHRMYPEKMLSIAKSFRNDFGKEMMAYLEQLKVGLKIRNFR